MKKKISLPKKLTGSNVELFRRKVVGKISSCTKCRINELCHKKVQATGNLNADLMFISYRPTMHEDLGGYSLDTPSSFHIRELLRESNLNNFKRIYVPLISCIPLDGKGSLRDPSQEEILNCLPHLIQTIDIVKPKALIFVGIQPKKLPVEFDTYMEDLVEKGMRFTSIYHPEFIESRGGKQFAGYGVSRTNLIELRKQFES